MMSLRYASKIMSLHPAIQTMSFRSEKMFPRNQTLGATVIAWSFSIQQFCFEFGKNKGPKRRDD